MPFLQHRYMQRKAQQPTAHPMPHERRVPLLGSAQRPTALAELITAPFVYVDKISQAQMSAFADEMQKISYVKNTEGDKAGVLRALLLTLMGRPVHPVPGDGHAAREQMLLYGGEEGRQNYTQAIQAELAQDLMQETQLAATMEAMQHRTSRIVGS